MAEDEITRRKTLKDLGECIISGTLGYFAGRALAWVYPQTIPKQLNELMNHEITRRNYVGRVSLAGGYIHQLSNFIVDIAREPSDWKSYIPIVTNAVVGVGLVIVNKIGDNKRFTQGLGLP